MHRTPILTALLIGTAFTLCPPAAAAPTAPAPYCDVEARATPTAITRVTGMYTVAVTVAPTCPANGYAEVRLESYIGGMFPRDGWFRITRTHPLVRTGVPWYWRARVRSQTGLDSFPLVIPGMRSPFKRPR